MSQLLSYPTTEGDPEHVYLVVSEFIEHLLNRAGHSSHPARPTIIGRFSRAGMVVTYCPDTEGHQSPHEGSPHANVAPDPHHQQQGTTLTRLRHMQPHAVDVDVPAW
jgi:hypothetical protein